MVAPGRCALVTAEVSGHEYVAAARSTGDSNLALELTQLLD
jgi:hypothetical protein